MFSFAVFCKNFKMYNKKTYYIAENVQQNGGVLLFNERGIKCSEFSYRIYCTIARFL